MNDKKKEVLKSVLSGFAPILAAAVGGPTTLAGGAISVLSQVLLGRKASDDDELINAVQNATPEQKADIIRANNEFKVALAKVGVDEQALTVSNAKDINTTMVAEAQSNHWPTYSWRPAIGFSVAFNVAMTSIVVSLAYMIVILQLHGTEAEMDAQTDALQHIPAMIGAMAALIGVVSPILGIASWFRGKAQADPVIPTDNRG